MIRKKYLIISIFLMILLNIGISFEGFTESKEKEILIINSHTENYAWTNDVLKGMFETINSSELNTNIHMESFDYKYYQKDYIEEDIYNLVRDNYLDKEIDLLITTDLEATQFAIKYQEELFKDVPIVFSGLSRFKSSQITKGVSNITGVIERPNIEETLETAIKITPDAKNVYVINDDTDRGKRYFNEIKEAALKLDNKLNVETLENIDDMKSDVMLRDIPKDSIVIGTIYLEDEKGMTISMSEVVRKLSKSIDIPIFYLQESTIGHGALGGNVLSPKLHGINTGKLALRILEGEIPSNIEFIEENNSKNIFDYNIMKKFNISADLLPKDSEIVNKPYNLYDEHGTIIIGASIIIVMLLLFIAYLSFNIKRRKQVEKDMIIVNKDLVDVQDELESIAYYDEITGLPNMTMFIKNMNNRLNKKTGTIIYMDIDDFRNINDTFGHDFGDLLLIELGERLKSVAYINDKDINVYKINGDEYILDIDNINEEYIENIAKKVQNVVSKSFNINNQDIKVSVSMGIVYYSEDILKVEDIFKRSELSMYKAKELGKNCYKIYEKHMDDEITEKNLFINNLKKALEKDEFILNYQPQVNSETAEIVGFESLIRWNSSEYGLVSPAKFIPIAEETGEITKIGEWVFRKSCEFTLAINKKFNKKIEVSVNVSSIQLKQDDFIEMIKRIIKETGVEPEVIGIEVTETSLMESFDENFEKLEMLREMGFVIYLDDFGTGYSSLNYLLRLPINTIKIDKSFIDDMMIYEKGRKITEKIIKLAHGMGLGVVAEGVEEEQQLSLLKDLRCDVIQGYIYGKPLSEDDANVYMEKSVSRI